MLFSSKDGFVKHLIHWVCCFFGYEVAFVLFANLIAVDEACVTTGFLSLVTMGSEGWSTNICYLFCIVFEFSNNTLSFDNLRILFGIFLTLMDSDNSSPNWPYPLLYCIFQRWPSLDITSLALLLRKILRTSFLCPEQYKVQNISLSNLFVSFTSEVLQVKNAGYRDLTDCVLKLLFNEQWTCYALHMT